MSKPDYQQQLTKAVEQIETTSGIELVVAIVPRVSTHFTRSLGIGITLSMLTLTVLMFMPLVVPYWEIYLATIAAFVLPFGLLELIPPLKRLVNSKKHLAKLVELHARATFQKNHLTETSGRTGCLVYLAEFEQVACVVGDIGIESELSKAELADLQARFTETLKASDTEAALLQVLDQLRPFFDRHFPPRDPNFNELPDYLEVE